MPSVPNTAYARKALRCRRPYLYHLRRERALDWYHVQKLIAGVLLDAQTCMHACEPRQRHAVGLPWKQGLHGGRMRLPSGRDA